MQRFRHRHPGTLAELGHIDADSLLPAQQATPLTLRKRADVYETLLLKYPGLATFHSYPEFLHALLREADPDVATLVPQPFLLRVNGRRYVPDCYLQGRGTPKVIELKPRGAMDETTTLLLTAFFRKHHLRFAVQTNEDVMARETEALNWLPLVQILVLADRCALDTHTEEERLYQEIQTQAPLTVGELLPSGDRTASEREEIALYRLLYHHRVDTDLSQAPLSYDSVLTPADKTPDGRDSPSDDPATPQPPRAGALESAIGSPASRLPDAFAMAAHPDGAFLSWRERLAVEPHLADLSQWPFLDVASLANDRQRQGFLRNQGIVARALCGEPLKHIAEDCGVPASRVTRLLTRCLAGIAEQRPALTAGLVPGTHLQRSVRRAPLPRLDTPRGSACAFTHLLEHAPGLKRYLDKMIKTASSRSRHGQNISADAFHKALLRYLKGQNWPADTYPFTAAHRAYESARQYLRQQQARLAMPRPARRVVVPPRTTAIAFREVHIDEQVVDAQGAIGLNLNEAWEPLRIARFSVLLARDADTSCPLARWIALTQYPSASDLLHLFAQLISRWSLPSLRTPGLTYLPGAAYPNCLDGPYPRAHIGMIRLDNALAHLAHVVRDFVCVRMGTTLNMGLPAQPLARQVVEQAFHLLNIDLHRLPSTTGSHPADPLREPSKHAKRPPIASLTALEEAIDVIFTGRATRALGNLGGQAPLDVLRYQMAQLLLPLRPSLVQAQLQPFVFTRLVTVRKPEKDHGRPYINFEGTRYRGDNPHLVNLINQSVQIAVDIRDIRCVIATTCQGRPLGEFKAPRSWQRFAHGLSTRRHINKLVREKHIDADDPLGNYFDYLLRNRHLPSSAMEGMRVFREAQAGGLYSMTPSANPEAPPATPTQPRPRPGKTVPAWTPDMVERRE